jgi:maltose/maltodextrin transport system substrate-binding protein
MRQVPAFGQAGFQSLEKIVNKGEFMPNIPGYQTLLFEALEPLYRQYSVEL